MGALDAPNAAFARIYVNLNAEFEGDSLRNTYGPAKFDRLRKIKAVYDPTNVSGTTPTSRRPDR